MNTNYQSIFGFTIGPIYELMSHSKKTRELWFSSFFFSWYVKELYIKLENLRYFRFLKPKINISLLPKSKAGLFPDHIVAYSEKDVENTFNDIEKCINENNQYFIDVINNLGKAHYLSGKSKTDVEKIFNDYLQTNFIVVPAKGINENEAVKTIENYLDALERNRSFTLRKNEPTCYRCKSLPAIFEIHDKYDDRSKDQEVCPFCFLKFISNQSNEICAETSQKSGFRYRSTGEIAADELIRKINVSGLIEYFKNNDEIEYEGDKGEEFKKLLPEKGKEIRPYHKYMAIVQADGDNLGETANKVQNPEELSELLFEFGQEALDITIKYHGEAIYIGGDDILSFMPTAFKDGDFFFSIIDYVNELSMAYKHKLYCKGLPGSLSVGVHLFYYKSPLSLAIQNAREQLFDVAKKIPGKDSVALLLTQHSGQKIGLQFKFCSDELELFNSILKNTISGKTDYPKGIHHKLSLYRNVLTNLTGIDQIDYFFINRFNEDIHKTYSGLEYIKKYLTKMLSIKTSSGVKILNGEKAEEKLSEFISHIKFIKFLSGED
jgi:CRISPR-associated protein Cmr2